MGGSIGVNLIGIHSKAKIKQFSAINFIHLLLLPLTVYTLQFLVCTSLSLITYINTTQYDTHQLTIVLFAKYVPHIKAFIQA